MGEGNELRGMADVWSIHKMCSGGPWRGGEQSQVPVVWNFEATWGVCSSEDADSCVCEQQEQTFTVPAKDEAEAPSIATVEK